MNKNCRKFLLRAFLFGLPLALGWAALEHRLNQIDTPSQRTRKNIEAAGPQAEALVVGTSHAVFGFDAAVLGPKTLSLADFSQSLEISSQLVQRYLPQMPKLKFLLVDISDFSLEYNLNDSPESWRNFYYHYYLGVRGDGGLLQALDLRNYSLYFLNGPARVLQWLLNGFPETIGTDADLAARNNKVGSNETNRALIHQTLMHPSYIEANQRAIKKMIEAALYQNLRVLMVTLPLSEDYREHFQNDRIVRMKLALNQVLQQFSGLAVSYRDYQNDSRFGPESFLDTDHLNRAGAEKFSRIISQELH